MGFFDIRLTTATSLHPFEDPSDYIAEYTGIIRYERERDGRVFKVGKVRAYRIHAGLAADHGIALYDVCDAHSHQMHRVHAVIYNRHEDSFKDKVIGRFYAVESDCLVLDYLVLHPKWRGLKLGMLAARKVVDLLGGGCGLTVADVQPLDAEAHDLIGVPAPWIPRHDTPDALRDARQKLRHYFRRMGFRRIGKTTLHGLSMAKRTPTGQELLNPSL